MPTDNPRPRRSVLYMPAANERALEKAKAIPADALIFDLEDAVAPDAKDAARKNAVAAIESGEYGNRELTIRCNGLDTPWGESDIAAAGAAGPSAIVIPKVGSAADLDAVSAQLDAAGASADVKIWAMIETPLAIFNAREIAGHRRVDAVVIGTNDLVKELRAQAVPGRKTILPYLSTALLACRAEGTVALDGVYNDVRDPDGFAIEAQQGFDMGFDGKTLVHPSQVEPANTIWSPSAEEIAEAQEIIAAFEAAGAGAGVITVNGKMIEALHVDMARRTLSVASAIK